MPQEFIVRSIDEYLALPELDMPPIPDEKASGVVYEVHKVGFYLARKEEIQKHKLDADFESEADGFLLPTAVVMIKQKKTFFRLPCSLTGWVRDAVATAHAVANPFPSKVEFGIFKDRHYAEIL